MSGPELKAIADRADLKPVEVCGCAGVSINTLYKVYNDKHVKPKFKDKVQRAVLALAAKAQAVAV